MVNTRRIGKRHEDVVAEMLGGKRVSAPWKAGPDVIGKTFVAECKARKKLPQWIENALQQAERDTNEGQLAVAVLHEKNRHYDNDLVVIRMKDFREWFDGNGELSNSKLSE